MNKKLLGLLMAVIIGGTSMPSLTASAAKINNVQTAKSSEVKASYWHSSHIYGGTELYSQPYSDCHAGYVATSTDVSYQYYGDNWYYVFIQGKYFYVYGFGHFY